MKTIIKFACGVALTIAAFCLPAKAQIFTMGTYVNQPTNSQAVTGSPIVSTPFPVQFPAFSLTFSGATNPATTSTNIFTEVLQITNTVQFVYNAGTMGTNFVTNFPATFYLVTNNTVGWVFPQGWIGTTPTSNTFTIK